MPIVPDPGFSPQSPLVEGMAPNYQAEREAPTSLNTLASLQVNFMENTWLGVMLNKTIPNIVASAVSEDEPGFDPYEMATDTYFEQKPWMFAPFADGSMDGVRSHAHMAAVEMSAERSYNANQRLATSSWYNTVPTGIVAMVPEILAGGELSAALKFGPKLAAIAGEGAWYTKALKGAAIAAGGNVAYGQTVAALDPTRAVGDAETIAHDAEVGAVLGGILIPIVATGFTKAADRLRLAAGETKPLVSTERLERVQADTANSYAYPGADTATEAVGQHAQELRDLLARKAWEADAPATNPKFWMDRPQTNPPFWMEQKAGQAEPLPATGPRWSDDVVTDFSTPAATNPKFWVDRPPMAIVPEPRTNPAFWLDKPRTNPKWAAGSPDTNSRWSYDTPDTNPSFWLDRPAAAADESPAQFAPVDEATNPGFWLDKPRTLPAWASSAASPVAAGGMVTPAAVLHDTAFLFPDQVQPDGRIHKTILQTPETLELMQSLKDKHGDGIEFHEHPDQAVYDAKLALEELDKTFSSHNPIPLGKSGKIITAIGDVTSPAARAVKDPYGLLAKRALQITLDFSRKPGEWIDALNPNHTLPIPAEGFHWILQGNHQEYVNGVAGAMDAAQRAGGFEYTMSNGETVTFRGRTRDRNEFGRALWDVIARSNNEARGDKLLAYQGTDIPAALSDAALAHQKYKAVHQRYAVEAGMLPADGPDISHLSQAWDTKKIVRDQDGFVNKLYNHVRYQRTREANLYTSPLEAEVVHFPKGSRVKGERAMVEDVNGTIKGDDGKFYREAGLNEADRKIIDKLVAEKSEKIKLQNAQVREAARAVGADIAATNKALREIDPWDTIKVQDLKEAGVNPERYIEEQKIYDKARVVAMKDTLLKPSNSHGVEEASDKPNVFRSRQVAINQLAMRDFLHDNALELADAYAYRVSGKVASRLAVKRDAGFWAPIVKEYTGKDLAKESHDPRLVVEAVSRHFDEAEKNALKAGDTAAADRYSLARTRDVGLLNAHLDKLEGSNLPPSSKQANGWKLGTRLVGRGTTMAMQGTSLISNVGDVANLAAMNFMGESGTKTIGQWFKNFATGAEPGIRDLQGMRVHLMSRTHNIDRIEVGDMLPAMEKQPYGPGLKGKVMTGLDKGSSAATNRFYQMNLMRRWAQSGNDAIASALYNHMVVGGSQKLVRLADDIAGGMSREAALAKHGLNETHIEHMGRLGLNITKARRILDKIDEHGITLDVNDNPVKVDRTYDGYISLEGHRWADKDPELWDTIQNAINSETMNLQLEPKQAYRFLSNDTSNAVRLMNSMTSFTNAHAAQFMPLLLRRTGAEKAAWVATTLAMSAAQVALRDKLSGRRSFEDTANEWMNNPGGMMYGAVISSPLLGWLQKPIGIMDSAHIGPNRIFNNQKLATVYNRSGNTMLDAALGPAYTFMSNAVGGTEKTLRSLMDTGDLGDGWKQSLKSLPGNNLWQLRTLYRAAEDAGYGTIDPARR